jgi:hypothetical protein
MVVTGTKRGVAPPLARAYRRQNQSRNARRSAIEAVLQHQVERAAREWLAANAATRNGRPRSGRGMLVVSVARQLRWGNSLARLLCCPTQAERGRKKAL